VKQFTNSFADEAKPLTATPNNWAMMGANWPPLRAIEVNPLTTLAEPETPIVKSPLDLGYQLYFSLWNCKFN
jgi:hypothetical protein